MSPIGQQSIRARILMGRCFGGSIHVITASLPLGSWPYQIGYGWGALVKAGPVPGLLTCARPVASRLQPAAVPAGPAAI